MGNQFIEVPINKNKNEGTPLFGPAKEIHLEHQEVFARIRCNDGTWLVMNCWSGEIIIQNCSKILELPLVTVICAGVQNGNVVGFSLHPEDDESTIIFETEEYDDVKQVLGNDYIIVKKNEKYGVLSAYNGETLIQPEYISIERIISDSDVYESYFLCKDMFGIPTIHKFT